LSTETKTVREQRKKAPSDSLLKREFDHSRVLYGIGLSFWWKSWSVTKSVHGDWIDAVLVMTTTDGAEHRGQIRLWTDRPGRTKKEAETENRLSPTFNCVMSIVLSEWADWLDGGDSLSRKT